MLAVASLHDSALRVGEVILVRGLGLRAGFLGFRAAWLLAFLFLGRPLGHLGLVGRQVGGRPQAGARFDLGPRGRQLGLAFLPPLYFSGDAQPVFQGLTVGVLGFGHQFFDFQVQLLDGFAGVLVADGGVLAGVGHHLGSIHRHRDLTDLQKLQRLRQFQDPHKGLLQQRFVFTPEGANGVVVRVGVAAHHAHGHAVVAGLLDAP